MERFFIGCTKWKPPWPNCKVTCLGLVHVLWIFLRIFVLLTQRNMLFVEYFFDILLDVLMKRSTPMEQTCPFTVLYFFIRWIATVNNTDRFPIGHSAIYHESLKVCTSHSVSFYNNVQVPSKLYLDLSIFRLHIKHCNGHDPLVLGIIHVIGHCILVHHVPNVVKNHPCCRVERSALREYTGCLVASCWVKMGKCRKLESLRDLHLIFIWIFTWIFRWLILWWFYRAKVRVCNKKQVLKQVKRDGQQEWPSRWWALKFQIHGD